MVRYVLFAVLAGVFGLISYDLGQRGARAYEQMLGQRIKNGLSALGIAWADIYVDGLQVELRGHAPDLFARELAVETAQATVPVARVTSYATATLAPPEHRDPVRIELHRDSRGVTLTGQTASRTMREQLNKALQRDGQDLTVRDLTGIQAATPPPGWGAEMTVASLAASRLPNAYVVIEPGTVTIEGEVSDEQARSLLTNELLERGGGRIAIVLRLDLPAEVIVPFAFSAYKDAGAGMRLERCAARSTDEQATLSSLLGRLRVEAPQQACPVGLGGPGGDWTAAIEAGLTGLDALPAGRIDIEYRSVRLTAYPPTAPDNFDNLKTSFLAAVPEGFNGRVDLQADDIATLTGISRERYWMRMSWRDDQLVIAGQVPDAEAEDTIQTYAQALFGGQRVNMGVIIMETPPPASWQSAALGMLETLSKLRAGDAELAGYGLSFRGDVSMPAEAEALHRALSQGLPDFRVTTRIRVDLPSELAQTPLPGPRCASELSAAIQTQPIDFDTGSAVISKESAPMMDELARIFTRCIGERIEISGHTDSQGSEELNQRISQARADAVLAGLVQRGISADRLAAQGYGETEPIADNATEAGRARNRRIEFRLAVADEADPAAAQAPPATDAPSEEP